MPGGIRFSGGGAGGVQGPASAIDHAITRFDGTTGKVVQSSFATVDDSGALTTGAGIIINTGNLTLNAGNIFLSGTVDGRDVATDGAKLDTIDSGAQSDHGGLTGLLVDDHTQYSLADGTRDFTGVVVGVTPTLAAHLATKGYVDGIVITDHGALSGLGDDDHGAVYGNIGDTETISGAWTFSALLTASLGLTVNGALTDIGGGTYSLADGDNDLGVAGDLEVIGNTELTDTVGIGTSPPSALKLDIYSGDSAIASLIRGHIDAIYSGAPPSSGFNVLDYTLTDNLSGGAAAGTSRGAYFKAEYDRATVSDSTHRSIESVFGVAAPMTGVRTLSANTHTWHGLYVSCRNASGGDVTGGTINATGIEVAPEPTGYGSSTFTYLAAKFGGDVHINPGILDIEEDVSYSSSLTDGYSAAIYLDPHYTRTSGLGAVARHNYINLENPTAGVGSITAACVFRFDAAPGTHRAVDSGTTKTTPGTVNAWEKRNVNGTIYYVPMYTSKTS